MYVETYAEVLAERSKPDYARIASVLALLIGVVLVYLDIVAPILDAKPGGLVQFGRLRERLYGEVFIVLGLLGVVFGRRLKENFERSPKFGAAMGVLIVISCLLAQEIVKQLLRNRGYLLP